MTNLPTADITNSTTRRNMVRNDILDCRACHRREDATAPVVFCGKTPAKFMMIGDAPTALEQSIGSTTSHHWLARTIEEVGLPPLPTWLITNAVCCHSPDAIEPSALQACEPLMRAQLEIADPEWVVVLGAAGLSRIGVVKDPIGKAHGRPFEVPAGLFKGRWVFPTYAPGAIWRDDKKKTEIAADLASLSQIWHGTLNRDFIARRIGAKGKLVAL